MAKKQRVPETLWRVYRDRARTLADTIIYLLPEPPPSSAECQCKGRRCLGCSGAAAMSLLVRDGDPSEYKKLLFRCFVVLSENAPRLTVFYPDGRWSQREIVRRTIEMTACDRQMSSNVIHNGYNKLVRSSTVVDSLTTSAWSLLLRRIGDDTMIYLLKFTSIFLPLPHESLYQAAGIPMSVLSSKFSKCISGLSHQPPLSATTEPTKKRKGSDNDNNYLANNNSAQYPLGSAVFHVGDNHWDREYNLQEQRKHREVNSFSANTTNTCNAIDNDQRTLNGVLQGRSTDARTKSKKRPRQFSWQRHRKRRQVNSEELLTTCITTTKDKDVVTWDLQNNSSEISTTQCFCHLMMQAEQRALYGEINRKHMYYNSKSFSTLFPKEHILNILKPTDTGALSLAKDIFGLSVENLISKSLPCFHKYSCRFCLKEATCLYHLLHKFLKSLMRRTLSCQYLKLLDRHCPMPTLVSFARTKAGSLHEGDKPTQTELLEINRTDFERACVSMEKSSSKDKKMQQKHRHRSSRNHEYELNESCSKNQVVSFIWAVCRSIVPLDFLGPPSNWRALRRNISKFIRLRRHEKFSLKQCMHRLKSSSIPLLSNKYCSCYLSNHSLVKCQQILTGCNEFSESIALLKNKLFSCLVYWFFSCLVVPIVQANFYVTESEVGRQEMFYFRKPVWEKLTTTAITCLREQSYCLLDDGSLRCILRKRKFGFSKVRFCPKENGMRVLANLTAPSNLPLQKCLSGQQSSYRKHLNRMQRKVGALDKFKSVNHVLHDLSAVLKEIKMKHPEKLGSSVFDYNDVYEKLCPFITSLKKGSVTIPNVYVVIGDVSKAFDSIKQDKLLDVMKEVIMNDEYLIRWSPEVICTKKALWVHHACMLDQNPRIAITKSTRFVPSKGSHIVRVNQETSRKLSKVELYDVLREHVKFNVLQLGQQFYLQKVGISQGSIISSLLCSFYYGHLEKNVILPFLEQSPECHIPEPLKDDLSERRFCQDSDAADRIVENCFLTSSTHILMRFIDDFLFISTSKQQAVRFFSRFQRGFREYNCSINDAKSCMNFHMGYMSGLSSRRMCMGDDGISFLPWSGLLINSHSLEIQADYTRYLDIHLSSTLTVCWLDKPGQRLKEKLFHYMRPKCHPIFYDSNINSASVVRLNVYQAFLLCAMKFHCYVCSLSSICTLGAEHHSILIRSCVRYMHKLIKRRMYSRNFGSNIRPVLKLKKQEVVWLGLKAFIRVLQRKQSQHYELLSLLKSELLAADLVESGPLKYAVDDSHSSVFWKMKY